MREDFGMNIESLKEFVYLAETLHFAATARHFFVRTSVLSKHVFAMENVLQVKLFERDAHHVQITEAGQTLYRDAVKVVSCYDRMIENLEAQKSGGCRRLKVGYLRGAAQPFLAHFVRYMESDYPEISLDLRCMEYGDLIKAHRSQEVDLIFNMDFDPEAAESCDFERVYTDRLYVVVGKKHRLARQAQGVRLSDLTGERFILPDNSRYPGLAQRYRTILGLSFDPESTNYYQDIDTLYLRIACGQGIGFSSGHNYQRFREKARFVPLLDIDTSYTVSVQWLKRADASIAEIGREIGAACARKMENWKDGIGDRLPGRQTM